MFLKHQQNRGDGLGASVRMATTALGAEMTTQPVALRRHMSDAAVDHGTSLPGCRLRPSSSPGEAGAWPHVTWIDDDNLLSWTTCRGVTGSWCVLLDGAAPQAFAQGLIGEDSHASLSPDRCFLLGDSYPDAAGERHL